MVEKGQRVRRKVELKIIKPGTDSRRVIAPFEAERQAVAMMDHPNIAGASTPGRRRAAGPTASWSWSRACPSLSIAARTGTPARAASLWDESSTASA
jgi:serine/threonine-protein kinase